MPISVDNYSQKYGTFYITFFNFAFAQGDKMSSANRNLSNKKLSLTLLKIYFRLFTINHSTH